MSESPTENGDYCLVDSSDTEYSEAANIMSDPSLVINSQVSDTVNLETPTSVVETQEPMNNIGRQPLFLRKVAYLGNEPITDNLRPDSTVIVNGVRAILFNQANPDIDCSLGLSLPGNCHGELRVYRCEPAEKILLDSYFLTSIPLCVHVTDDPLLECIFAFAYPQNNVRSQETDENSLHKIGTNDRQLVCHAFQCQSMQEASAVVRQLNGAFYSVDQNTGFPSSQSFLVGLRIHLDIQEDDGRGHFSSVPRDLGSNERRNQSPLFRLRANVDKQISIHVQQISGQVSLTFLRCVGMFVGPGRYLKDGDLVLLESESSETRSDRRTIACVGSWHPRLEKDLAVLNEVTEKESTRFFTVGVHIYAPPIEQPLTLKLQLRTRVFPETERFWLPQKRSLIVEECELLLSRIVRLNAEAAAMLQTRCGQQDVCETSSSQIQIGQLEQPFYHVMSTRYLHKAYDPRAERETANQTAGDLFSPGTSVRLHDTTDEPLLSGTGTVSKEVTDDDQLQQWEELLKQWHQRLDQTPDGVPALIRRCGVPEALRGEVWILLSGVRRREAQLLEVFKILISKDSEYDACIQRDMNRTFPGNEQFSQHNSHLQQQLFRVSKTYSLYDQEIGYVQGISFLIAALLLHMPEEQSFLVLVQIMYDFRLRNIICNNFTGLKRSLHQLDCLMQDNLVDLWRHFNDLNIQPMMFASQWFITLFSSKFPLHAVYSVLDIFLCEGFDVIFKVALALLKISRKELLSLDFDGVLKFFRVNLPRQFQHEQACKALIKAAVKIKLNKARMERYGRDWDESQRLAAEAENPLEVARLQLKQKEELCHRLEQENDALERESIHTKTRLHTQIEQLQDRLDALNLEAYKQKVELIEVTEERDNIRSELEKVKDLLRCQTLEKDQTLALKEGIINEYKLITHSQSVRLDQKDAIIGRLSGRMSAEQCAACADWLQGYLRQEEIQLASSIPSTNQSSDPTMVDQQQLMVCRLRCQDLEVELAGTKLELAQSHCALQKSVHEMRLYCQHIEDKLSAEMMDQQGGGGGLARGLWNRLRDMASSANASLVAGNSLPALIGRVDLDQ